MKIIHLSCVAPPDIGGIGRVAAKEVELLRERGIEAEVVSLSTHASFRIWNMGWVYCLEQLLREADIVHLHYPFYGSGEQAVWLKKMGKIKRLVMTLHMDATASGLKGLAFAAHRHFVQPLMLPQADALIVSSRDYADHSSFHNVAARTIEIPFGVDEEAFKPMPSMRSQFNIPDGVQVVACVGSMDRAHAFKGVDILLQALAALPAVHVLLVGDGALRSGYERLVKELGIAERCHFAGRVSEADLPNAYRAADILAAPSISGAEAFSLVAIEAQACGIPVVASNLPGVRSVVRDEETGLLVPAGDVQGLTNALSSLLQDKERCRRMGARAHESVLETYTWGKHVEKLTEVYRKITINL